MAVGAFNAVILFFGVSTMLAGMMLATMYWCPWTTALNGKHLFSVLAAGGYSLVAYIAIILIFFR